MSDEALRRRIRNITNIPKMRSFVDCLKTNGMHELQVEAEAALQALLQEL